MTLKHHTLQRALSVNYFICTMVQVAVVYTYLKSRQHTIKHNTLYDNKGIIA